MPPEPAPPIPADRHIAQQLDELAAFIDLMRRENVMSYLEVGLKFGGMFETVGEALPSGATMVGIDMPGGPWGNKGGVKDIKRAAERLRVNCGQNVKIIWGDSRHKAVIGRAREAGPYDLVFIDADHTLQAVTQDWKHYRGMARIVAFHDIVGKQPCEVFLLWATLKRQFRHLEIIGAKHGMGIGVVWQ